MNSENDLIQKLMISKKIMDIHNNKPRSQNSGIDIPKPVLENFEVPNASYNIPQDILQEVNHTPKPINPNQQVPVEQRIMSSRLPDEIKRLMIEHPISQPNSVAGPTLSNDLVEKASRLMGVENNQKQSSNSSQRQNVMENFSDSSSFRETLKEVVREVLSENGLLVESSNKANDVFSFRVGKHIFEGKVIKIKKVQ